MRARSWILVAIVAGLAVPGRGGEDQVRTDSVEAAVATLRQAPRFALGGIGFAGVVSEEEKALRLLLTQPGAERLFDRLLQTATPEGQLYALLGCEQVATSVRFEAAATTCRRGLAGKKVSRASGCFLFEKPATEVIDAIVDGGIRISRGLGEREASAGKPDLEDTFDSASDRE